MIDIFSVTFPSNILLLEYEEDRAIEDFDLSIPLNSSVLDQVISPRYPDLIDSLRSLYKRDSRAGVMIDHFLSETSDISLVSFSDPASLLNEFGVEANLVESKEFYAVVIYLGREKLVRTIYRNPENPGKVTDVHNSDGSFSHHETIYQGELPENLNWAHTRLQELKDLGANVAINHFKDNKVYFSVKP